LGGGLFLLIRQRQGLTGSRNESSIYFEKNPQPPRPKPERSAGIPQIIEIIEIICRKFVVFPPLGNLPLYLNFSLRGGGGRPSAAAAAERVRCTLPNK
jgi:hypothetical protein